MLHRKIVEPVLADLEGERADYFQRLIQRVEENPRAEPIANLIYVTLKGTIPFLPTYLEPAELADALVDFVAANQSRLNRAIFDRSYVEDAGNQEEILRVTNEFVSQALAAVLRKYDDGEVKESPRTTYRFSGDFENEDFPYKDLDD